LLTQQMMIEKRRRKLDRKREKRDSDNKNKKNENKKKSERDEDKLENNDFEILKMQTLSLAVVLWGIPQKILVNDQVENANVKREERREKRKSNVNKKSESVKKRKGQRTEKC